MSTEFATALSRAISDQPLTLERIASRLREAGHPVSVATLSSWKRGHTSPTRASSLRSVTTLEHVLDLDTGTLSGLLDAGHFRPRDVVPGAEPTEELLADLRLTLDRHWARVSVHDRMVVDRDGFERHQVTRQVLRAVRDGAQRWPVVAEQDTDVPGVVPLVVATNGFGIVDVRVDPERHLTVAAASLPRPVRRGTVVVAEHQLSFGTQSRRSFRLERCVLGPVHELVLEVEFTGEAPRTVTRYHAPAIEAEPRPCPEPVARHGRWYQAVILDAQPGLHGIGWTW